MSITIVRTLQEKEWRNFVDNHPEGNVYHTPEMFQVFSRTKGFQPELWAATKASRILALLLPARITLTDRWFFRHFTTRSIAYGSVLCVPDGEAQEGVAQLLQSYMRGIGRESLFTELRNLSNLEAIQAILCEHGFVYEEHLNYLINLNRSFEKIFEKFGRRTRKNIKRGLRRGEVIIEVVNKREQVATCYNLVSQTYRRAHVPLPDQSLFEAAFELLHPKGMVRFTLARVGQVPVATSVELLYKKIIYGWFGGMDRAYGSYIPNELLMWHILNWGVENGYYWYDFGGAGKPGTDYGVREFKAKFGGELVCYGRNICIHSPISFRLSRVGYKISRRLLWSGGLKSEERYSE